MHFRMYMVHFRVNRPFCAVLLNVALLCLREFVRWCVFFVSIDRTLERCF